MLKSDKIIIKENLSKSIEENIKNKLEIDDLNQEIFIQNSEIDNLKNILSLYKNQQLNSIDSLNSYVNINKGDGGKKFYFIS